jgi:hypothetical protein
MKPAVLLAILLMLLSRGEAPAVEISLPRGGSDRVGEMMSVHVKLDADAPSEQTLTILADGAIPTILQMHGLREATAPLLVLSPNLQRLRVIDGEGRETLSTVPLLLDVNQPSHVFGEDAYAPTLAWRPGMGSSQRARIVQVGVLMAIAALACALLRGWRALGCLVIVSIVGAAGMGVWRHRSSDVAVATGVIVLEPGQVDRWRYFTTRSESEVMYAVTLSPGAIPVFADEAHVERIRPRLICDAASGEVRLETFLSRGVRLALLERRSVDHLPPISPDPQQDSSPMLELARRLYVNRDATIAGTLAPEPDPLLPDAQLWVGVVVRRR